MKQLLHGGTVVALLIGLSGCGGGNTHEGVLKDTIAAMNEMSDVLEKAKNADEAKPKLETLANRLKDLKKRAEALGKPTEAADEALKKKYEGELTKAITRFSKATMDFGKRDPAGAQKLEAVFKDLK